MKRLFVVLGLIIVATSVRCEQLEDNYHCVVEGRRAFDRGLPLTANPYPQIDRHEDRYVIHEHISGYTRVWSDWQSWRLGWTTEEGRKAFEAHLPHTANPYIQTGDKEKGLSWALGWTEASIEAAEAASPGYRPRRCSETDVIKCPFAVWLYQKSTGIFLGIDDRNLSLEEAEDERASVSARLLDCRAVIKRSDERPHEGSPEEQEKGMAVMEKAMAAGGCRPRSCMHIPDPQECWDYLTHGRRAYHIRDSK